MTADNNALIDQFVAAMRERGDRPDRLTLDAWRDEDWRHLLAEADEQVLKNGEILLRRGDPSNDLYFLVAGRLEVSIPQSRSISMSPVISIAPGSVVGEISFFDNQGRSASVWSRGTSVLLRLRQDTFAAFRETHCSLACDLLLAIGRIVAQRLRATQGSPMTHA
jgi:CRP-like cAMP-binding protein